MKKFILSIPIVVFLVLAIGIGVGLAQDEESRTWTDITGKYSTEAKLLRVEKGIVHLVNADGQPIEMEFQKLSLQDQKHVENYAAAFGGTTSAAAAAVTEAEMKPEDGAATASGDATEKVENEGAGTPKPAVVSGTESETEMAVEADDKSAPSEKESVVNMAEDETDLENDDSSEDDLDSTSKEPPVIFYVFFGFAALLIFVGNLWLIVVAFSESLLWGLGVLFLPIVPLIFIVSNWEAAKSAVICMLFGIALAAVTLLLIP